MMAVRDTLASSADHTRISELPSEMATQASGLQTSATEAIRDFSFLGPADLLSSDSGLFGDVSQSVGFQSPAAPAPRPPLSEGEQPPTFSGQNFVEAGPPPVLGGAPLGRTRPARNSNSRGEQEGVELDGVPQIGATAPEKPFYMGLVGVPGVGFMNTVFSRHPSGEFDPTRGATEALLAQPLSNPDTSQPRAMTPAVVRLNINPKDMVLTYAKKVTATRVRANYIRREMNAVTGFTVEHHWDELDTVSLNCTTGNFWVNGGLHYPRGGHQDSGSQPTSNSVGRGFQGVGFLSANRSKSLAYRKLQAVMAMFRNNGCGWLTSNTQLRSDQEQQFFGKDYNIVVNPGTAFLMYDNIIWYGHFESMKVNEQGENPNAFDFSIEFKVARTVDLNGVSEADVLTGSEIGGESFFTDSVESSRQVVSGNAQAIIQERREQERADIIRANTRADLERERKKVAAELIEKNTFARLLGGGLSDEQIDRLSKESAAKTVTSAVNRTGSGG